MANVVFVFRTVGGKGAGGFQCKKGPLAATIDKKDCYVDRGIADAVCRVCMRDLVVDLSVKWSRT